MTPGMVQLGGYWNTDAHGPLPQPVNERCRWRPVWRSTYVLELPGVTPQVFPYRYWDTAAMGNLPPLPAGCHWHTVPGTITGYALIIEGAQKEQP